MWTKEPDRNTTRFWSPPRSFYRDYVPPKRPFANWSLTILVRSNPAKRKMEFSGKNRGSKTRAALSPSRPAPPLSTGFITIDWLHHDRRNARKRLHAVEWGVFFSQKIKNLVVAGSVPSTTCLSTRTIDRYAIEPVGPPRVSTRNANRGGLWISIANVLISAISRVSRGRSGRIAFFHENQTLEPLRGN